jgi:hypothetical protein
MSTGPIFDLDAEQALLGAMLSNQEAAEAGVAALGRGAFYRDRDQRIFSAIADALCAGESPDVVTVAARMSADDELRDYIRALPGLCPAATNVKKYAAIVLRDDERRGLRRGLAEIAQLVEGNSKHPAEIHRRAVEIWRAVAPTTTDDPDHPRPRSYTGPEVAAMVAQASDPVALYADPGCLFDLVAASKAGKTSLALAMCKAVLRGEPFLDRPTRRVAILYLTEQTRLSFKAKLEAVGFLSGCVDFHVLFAADFIGSSWDEICSLIHAEVAKHGIGLLIVDTLSDWAKIKDENDSAEALEVTRPLRAIAQETGVAVFTVRHAGKGSKSGQDVVDWGRGSSAYAGVADTLCTMARTAGQGHTSRRQLRFVSRKDNVPENMVVEFRGGQYVSLGDAPNVEHRAACDFLLEHLPIRDGQAMTEREILDAADGAFSRRTLQRVLNGDHGEGGLLREGVVTGRKGAGSARPKAFGYWLRQDVDAEQMGIPDEL